MNTYRNSYKEEIQKKWDEAESLAKGGMYYRGGALNPCDGGIANNFERGVRLLLDYADCSYYSADNLKSIFWGNVYVNFFNRPNLKNNKGSVTQVLDRFLDNSIQRDRQLESSVETLLSTLKKPLEKNNKTLNPEGRLACIINVIAFNATDELSAEFRNTFRIPGIEGRLLYNEPVGEALPVSEAVDANEANDIPIVIAKRSS